MYIQDNGVSNSNAAFQGIYGPFLIKFQFVSMTGLEKSEWDSVSFGNRSTYIYAFEIKACLSKVPLKTYLSTNEK